MQPLKVFRGGMNFSRAANNGVGVDGLGEGLRCLLVSQEGGVAARGKDAEDAVANMVARVVIAIEAKEGDDGSQDLPHTGGISW